MGMIQGLFSLLFGRTHNVVRDTVEVFRENAESGAHRAQQVQLAALAQLAAEFQHPRKSAFDRGIDGLNRLPRPMLALGTLALLTSAMFDPIWFAARMQGIALVPEPLWWLLGIIVTFYFGARQQAKGQDFQASLAQSLAQVPQVVANLERLNTVSSSPSHPASPPPSRTETPRRSASAAAAKDANPALHRWQHSHAAQGDH